MKKTILVVYFIMLVRLILSADETGIPFISLYPTRQTGGHNMNWAFAQDNRGIIYVGNGFGVQEFDGSTWRMIKLPNGSFARSFAKDTDGRIYVGSATELGYLDVSKNGLMRYISLLDKIPPGDRSFNFIWSLHATPEGIYFQARERLFRFSHKSASNKSPEDWQIKIWRPDNLENYFVHSFYLDHQLYLMQRGVGLMRMVGDSLILIPGSQGFVNDRVHVMLPFPRHPGAFLLGTLSRGLFVYDGHSFKPFKTEADALLQQGMLYDGKLLPDGSFGLGTLSRGFLIIDTIGKIKLHLIKESGLLSNAVASIFVDRQKNIWLGMAGGVGILEYESGLSQFPIISGGVPNYLQRYRGIVYVSATDGVYYLDKEDSQFKYVAGLQNSGSSNFLVIDGHLYAANAAGIYLINETKGEMVLPYSATTPAFLCLHKSRVDTNQIFGGAINGLSTLKYDPKDPRHMKLERIVQGVHEYIRQIVEPIPGTLWLSTYNSGIIRVDFRGNDFNHPVIKRFGYEHGLPVGITSVFQVNRHLVFGTSKGIYQFDEKSQRFQPDSFFKALNLGINPGECLIVEDPGGNIWANAGKETAFYRKMADGSYLPERRSTSRFGDELVYAIYPENNSVVWFGTTNGVIRFTTDKVKVPILRFPALIRRVKFANDSTLYYGGAEVANTPKKEPHVPYRLNDMSFEFTALCYFKPESNEFQIMLEGYERNWSPWSLDSKRHYTNLSPGRYIFRVKARNIFGEESTEAAYAFSIMAPWYATWWAYLGYVLIALLAVYFLVQFRTRKLQAHSHALVKIVWQRTSQIQEQKENVEKLSRIGQDITSSLSIENIIHTVYENVNTLMDASVFTIGLHDPEENILEFPATIEKRQLLPPFSVSLDDEHRLAAWCFNKRQDVIINDYELDKSKYIGQKITPLAGESPESLLILPLWHKDKVIGVISAQSFNKNAYSDYHLHMLRNLAIYTAIALENADSYRRLNTLLGDLKATQSQLIQSEKMASLGELTAGIAHEIQNPLNFVNNFSDVSNQLLDEMKEELVKGNNKEALYIFKEIKQNLEKINMHGKRADAIVKGMLLHSRKSSGIKEPVDINALADEFLRLAYHGLRAKDKSFNARLKTDFDASIGKIVVIPQEMGRVILNLLTNAFYAVNEKKKEQPEFYEPTVSVSTKKIGNNVEIKVLDNGMGIPPEVLDKIFQPFFTTKPSGGGTGLGLSLSYDIITKMHGGELLAETKEGEYSVFTIRLPV